MADKRSKRREEMSRLHGEIWDATISSGIKRANELLDAKAPKRPGHLLHFTSAGALANILSERALRLTRARSSNDPKELAHGIDLARIEQDKLTRSRLDEIFRDELTAHFAGRMTDGTEHRSIDPHVCCLTETRSADVVAHWAMYGRGGSGFALKIRGKAMIAKPDVALVKINYKKEEQRAHLREVLAIGRETSHQAAEFATKRFGSGWGQRSFKIAAHAFGGIISLHAATMKAPEFAAEKEWRIVHTGMSTDEQGNPRIEARGAILRSYFDMKFEPEDLVSVIVGPVHADLNRPIVCRLLQENGYHTTQVETGRVALRALHEGI